MPKMALYLLYFTPAKSGNHARLLMLWVLDWNAPRPTAQTSRRDYQCLLARVMKNRRRNPPGVELPSRACIFTRGTGVPFGAGLTHQVLGLQARKQLE